MAKSKTDTHPPARSVATHATPVATPAVPAAPAPPQRQPAAGQPTPPAQPARSAGAAAITSESNYNQAKTTNEHTESERRATDEAEAQKKAHPEGLPLPSSGQPLTKPEPDQQK